MIHSPIRPALIKNSGSSQRESATDMCAKAPAMSSLSPKRFLCARAIVVNCLLTPPPKRFIPPSFGSVVMRVDTDRLARSSCPCRDGWQMVFLAAIACLVFSTLPVAAAPSDQTGSIIQVAFWNIRDFSTTTNRAADFPDLARIIHSNDCVAIAELNDKAALIRLCAELRKTGGKWKCAATSTKSGNTPNSKEYYGLVWRSDKLWKRTPVGILGEQTLAVSGDSQPYRFDREPAVCRFVTLDGRMDFTVLVVHVTWGKAEKYRKAEVRALTNYFSEVLRNKDKDVLLMGDFNQNVNAANSLTEILKLPTMIDTTSTSPPTVVDSANTYDHILFETQYVTEYTGTHGVTLFDEEVFHGDKTAAVKACSDHRPVWIQLKVPSEDDD